MVGGIWTPGGQHGEILCILRGRWAEREQPAGQNRPAEDSVKSWAVGPTPGLKGEQQVDWALSSASKHLRSTGRVEGGGVKGSGT